MVWPVSVSIASIVNFSVAGRVTFAVCFVLSRALLFLEGTDSASKQLFYVQSNELRSPKEAKSGAALPFRSSSHSLRPCLTAYSVIPTSKPDKYMQSSRRSIDGSFGLQNPD